MVLHNASQQHFLQIRSTACSTFRLLHGRTETGKFKKRKAVFKVYKAKGPLQPFVKGYEIAHL